MQNSECRMQNFGATPLLNTNKTTTFVHLCQWSVSQWVSCGGLSLVARQVIHNFAGEQSSSPTFIQKNNYILSFKDYCKSENELM